MFFYFLILTDVLEKIQAFLRDILTRTGGSHPGQRGSHAI